MDCEGLHTELPELLYGELEPERRAAAGEHLDRCPACRELLGELRAVREALPPVTPPPLLTAQIKLAARDALLARTDPVRTRGGTLHVLTTVVLAACVCLVGFGLGIYYQQGREATAPPAEPRLPLPRAPEDVEEDAPPPWIEVRQTEQDLIGRPPTAPPRSTAWQKVLHDAAQEFLSRGDLRQAREFFWRAAQVAPEGPLAAPARVGAAEALLRLGEKDQARAELEEIRRHVLAGRIFGNASLLQRIHELDVEAARPTTDRQ